MIPGFAQPETGWKCPGCSRIWSPHVQSCGTCNLELANRMQYGPAHSPGTAVPRPYPSEWR